MSRMLKVLAGVAGTIALTAITAAAVNELDKHDQPSRRRRNNNNSQPPPPPPEQPPTIHWPQATDETDEVQIYLDDNGVTDVARLKSDTTYARSACIRGFTMIDRGQCWVALLDHDNFMTHAMTRSADGQSIYKQLVEAEPSDAAKQSIAVIHRDVHRTRMIHGSSFNTIEEADRALNNVLCAYAKHDNVTGYSQGMNMIVAYMLTQVDEEQAYWILYTLMTNKHYNLKTVYATDLNGLLLFQFQFNKLFQHYLPHLFDHFAQHDVQSDVLIEMWMTLFTLQAMPRDVTGRIWDLYLCDGFKALHRCTLAILAQSSETLMTFDMEQIFQYIKNLPDHGVLNPDQLIATALSFNVTETLLDELTAVFNFEHKQPVQSRQQAVAHPVAQAVSSTSALRQRR